MPKIKRLRMSEVSGVDYPAHLANGFSIMKAVNPDKTAAFFKAAGREFAMTDKSTAKSLAEATPQEIAEVAKALTPEQLQPIIDAVNSVVEDAIDGGSDDSQEDAAGEVQAAAAADAAKGGADVELYDKDGNRINADGTPYDDTQKLLSKALGSEAHAVLKSLTDRAEVAERVAKAARDEVAVEKALRLDTQAITKSKASYPHLGIDHDTVAPALRKLSESDPATGKVIEGLMKALEGQTEAAALFKELGTGGGGQETDAYGKITARAEEIVAAEHVSKAVAITKALEEKPELYTEYQKEAR